MTTPDPTQTPVDPVWLPPGTRVGGYVVRRPLGSGGGQMAYLAEGPRKRPVVLKVSLFPKGERDSESRVMHRRFLRQVAFFLELEGVPGVAKVSAYGMYPDTSRDGHLYMVQEWVPRSRTIIDWTGDEPRPLNIIVCGWVMLAAACGEMARRGICHRDLNAGNVLMTPRGVPKIVDFNSGIGPGAERLTWPSARCVPGTPSSYSPEHCEAILYEYSTRRPVPFQHVPTGDLHALGVIFYEVLTGQHPFGHATGAELYERIARQVPDRPRVLNPDVPFGLEKVTMKLLQKKPEQRYQSGDQVALELEALFATGEDWSRPFRIPPRARRELPVSRTRRIPAVVGATAPALPPAIERAGPRPILLRGLLALARPPAPAPAPARLPPGRPKRRFAVAVLAVAAAVLFRGRPADDEDWLTTCAPEARKTVQELGIPDQGDAWLEGDLAGVGHGPFEATMSEGTLVGDLHAGPDGTSLRFTRLKLGDGRELPVCAYGLGGDRALTTRRLVLHFAR